MWRLRKLPFQGPDDRDVREEVTYDQSDFGCGDEDRLKGLWEFPGERSLSVSPSPVCLRVSTSSRCPPLDAVRDKSTVTSLIEVTTD